MGRGLPLFKLAGITVRLDWSLIIIFLLIAFSLAAGVFPAWHPDWSPVTSWVTALAAAVLFLASVLAHEFSHALVGKARGIEVKQITLFIFGGMAEMENEPPNWRAEFAMAAIGPITSLVLGFVFLFLAGLVGPTPDFNADDPAQVFAELNPLATLLMWLGPINIVLALFNLVPGYPLDGGRVLRALLWGLTGNLQRATRWASGAGQGFAWLLIGSGLAMMLGLHIPIFGTGFVSGLWLAFIGWFLNNAALVSYRQILVRDVLGDLPVRKLMRTDIDLASPDMTVQELVDQHLWQGDQRAFPVCSSGRLLGLVCLHDIRQLSRDQWSATTAEQLMTPRDKLVTTRSDNTAAEVLEQLARHRINQLPVMDENRLQGLIRREDIFRWLSVYGGDEFKGLGG